MRLSKLASAVENSKIIAKGESDCEILSLFTDSRKGKEGGLFFCLKGNESDGHAYAAEAVRNGAAAVVCERELFLSVPQILVDDVRSALGRMASVFFGEPSKR